MCGLKICVIGGGSSYTPELIDGFIKRSNEIKVDDIYLVDIKEGEEKLNIVGNLAKRMIKNAGLNTSIHLTLNRREALKGADFVITQFRVGGIDARIKDEIFPLKYNVLGQETTGPGGFAKALRTIPIMLDITKDMQELCPDAWLINFTNPSGLVTEAVLKYSKIKCIGLCNVPIHMKMNIAKMLDLNPEDLYLDFIGLNHLIWARKVWIKNQDITDNVINKLLDGASLSVKNITDLKWDANFLKALRMIPCPYLRYYYMNDVMVMEEKELASKGKTRGQLVREVEEELFKKYSNPDLKDKPKELEKRGGAYYSDAAVSLISAIFNDKKEIHVVNTLNNGIIDGIPNNCVIETNCIIDSRGATPLIKKEDIPIEIKGLILAVKSYEILAVESAVKGDKEKALLALVNHPLVPSVSVAKNLLNDLLNMNKKYLTQF
ncbi:MAG: 6-phospho-beta-glucosidase [Clostridiales bacterium]|nr:6-phospho-beta-glucosidase [Clostridiales bacterium]